MFGEFKYRLNVLKKYRVKSLNSTIPNHISFFFFMLRGLDFIQITMGRLKNLKLMWLS